MQQSKAGVTVKKIAPNCEMFFVIGSRNSSNSARLVEVAKMVVKIPSQFFMERMQSLGKN